MCGWYVRMVCVDGMCGWYVAICWFTVVWRNLVLMWCGFQLVRLKLKICLQSIYEIEIEM